jgi:hypothetical protein
LLKLLTYNVIHLPGVIFESPWRSRENNATLSTTCLFQKENFT